MACFVRSSTNALTLEQVEEAFGKRHVFTTGRIQGGNPFSRGQIYHLLTNPTYLGLIRHNDQTFPGLHSAIVDQDLWDRVQEHLKSASMRKRGVGAGLPGTASTPLKGKVRDETGDLLTPTHTKRRGKQLRYYVSNRLISGGTDPMAWRLPAPAFEDAVVRVISNHLQDHAERHAVLSKCDVTTAGIASKAIKDLAHRITSEGATYASLFISSVVIGNGRLKIALESTALAGATNLKADELHASLLSIDVPFGCRRRGVETKIIAGDCIAGPDKVLIRALRNAHVWAEVLKSGMQLSQVAARDGHSGRYIARVIAMISLSPKIQSAILTGTQPVELSLEHLVRGHIPLDWTQQENHFGFGP